MEFKIDKNDMLDKLKTNISPMFEILRNEGIYSDNYSVLLLLLTLHKDGLISSNNIDGELLKNNVFEKLHYSEKRQNSEYVDIIKSYEPILNRLSAKSLKQLIDAISEIDTSKNFPDIFDSVLYLISQSQGRYGGEFIQPIELTRFMCGLADLKPDAKVFNPFAGAASFGVFLDKNQYYYGQELNREIWAIGTLRLMAHGKLNCSNYVCDNSVSHWPEDSNKFDLIVSNPPLGMRLGKQYSNIEPELRTIEHLLISKSIHTLNQGGKLIALLSTGFLFKGVPADKNLRKFLIDEDLIDTIISLPGGLLQNTGVPLIILVLNKTKNLHGKVKFVDAENFLVSKGFTKKVLNDIALSKFLNSKKQDDNVIQIVDNSQIQANDYNLNVPRYFKKRIPLKNNERLVKLKEVLEYVKGQRGNLPEIGKFVRVRDLKDDIRDFQLNVSEIEEVELRKSGVSQINETSLLLSMRWNSLKPSLFVYEGESIYRNQDILSFKLNESIADYGYIIYELQLDYVQEQLKSYRTGTTIPFISIEDLLEVEIKLPSLEEQKAKVQGIYEITQKMKSLEYEINALSHGVSDKLYESVSTIKHSLGKPLLNIGSALSNIENALSKLNIDWENIKISERYDLTIKDSFNSVYSNLDTIHSILHNNETVLDISKYELEELDFITLIKGYVNRVKSAERKNVNINLDIHPDIENHLQNKVFVHANNELLEIGLNAIVENAHMHAFVDDSKKYKLEFRVSLYLSSRIEKEFKEIFSKPDNYIKVEVANNGKPFPKNYTLDKLVRKNSFAGETGNTGQGGFDLNEIIKYHNNGTSTLELINDDITSEFSTIYSFLIPLK